MFLGGLLVLTLFAALIGPYFIDWTSYRTAFEAEASRVLGQPVKVRGEADARLLPFPSVTFSDVAVGEGTGGAPMMTVERFSMDAELAPFLRGEVLIFDMRVERPSAVVRILPDGSLDWALSRRPSAPGETVVLEKVTVSDAAVTIVDDQNSRVHGIDDVDAILSARSLSGPWLMDGSATIAGRRGAFSLSTGELLPGGSVRLRARIMPDAQPVLVELEGEAAIADGKPRYNGEFTLQVLSAQHAASPQAPDTARAPILAAKGRFEADNARLRIPVYRMELGGGEDPYVVTGEATVDTGPDPDFLLVAEGQQVDMDVLAGAEPGTGQGTGPAVPLSERIAFVSGLIARLPPPPLPGRLSITLPAIIAGDTTLRDIAIDARPEAGGWEIDKLTASLPGRTTVEARGRLALLPQAAFAGSLVVASSQPSGLSTWLAGSVDPVIRRLGAAGFSANVDLSPALQRFETLEVAVGPAILKGRIERQSPDGGVPSVSLELSGDAFDVDAIRALALMTGAAGADGRFSAIGNLSGLVRAERLTMGDLSIGGLDTAFRVKDGRLTVERLDFADFGGASGRFSADLAGSPSAPQGNLSGTLTADRAEGLFLLGAQLTGGHAALARLARNATAFDDLTASVNARFDPVDGPAIAVKGTAGGSEITLNGSGTGLLPGGDGPRTLRVRLRNPEAWRVLEQAGFAVLPLDDAGPSELALTLTGGAPGGDLAIDATLTAGDTVISADGTGRIPADGPMTGLFSLGVTAGDIEPLVTIFGQALPQTGGALATDMTATVGMNADSVLLTDLAGSVAGNRFAGKLSFDRARGELSAEGALAVDRADLGWFTELALGPGDGQSDGATFTDAAFLPPVPGGPTGRIRLAASEFGLWDGQKLADFSADVTVGAGSLAMSGVEAGWLSGKVGGGFSLSNPDGTAYLSAELSLSDVDLERFVALAAGQSPAKGKASLKARVEGSGPSPRALAGALSGGGEFVINDLTIAGFHTGAFGRILGAADREGFEISADSVSALAADALEGGVIGADRAVLPFTLTNGVQRFAPVSVGDDQATLMAEGRIDLATLRTESAFRLTFDPGVEALAGTDPSVTIGIAGLVSDPGQTIDAAALANYLSVRAFERERRKVELLQAGVLEKQRLRREIALLAERIARREDAARAAAAAEEARVRAEEAAEAEAARVAAEEDAARALQAQQAREAAARAAAESLSEPVPVPDAEDGAGGSPPVDPPSLPLSEPSSGSPSQPAELDFRALPGVIDPLGFPAAPAPAQ